jgi:hypothetical protein
MALTKKVMILAKLESTYGTDAAPVNAVNGILCGSLNITPLAGDSVNRNIIQPFFGAQQKIMVTHNAAVDFEVELAGSGIAGTAPHYGTLLKACAFAETILAGASVTYAPITLTSTTQANTSVSIYFQRDGIKHVLLGARGTFTLDLTVKTLPKIKFNFTGLLGTITDSALVTTGLVYVAAVPVAVSTANTTPATIYGFTPVMESFTLDMANTVAYRSLIGTESVVISDRAPKGTLKVESPALATKDFFSIAQAGTLGEFSIQHGQTAGNIVTLASNATGMAIEAPKYGDNAGVVMLDMSYALIPTSAGNDELTLSLT